MEIETQHILGKILLHSLTLGMFTSTGLVVRQANRVDAQKTFTRFREQQLQIGFHRQIGSIITSASEFGGQVGTVFIFVNIIGITKFIVLGITLRATTNFGIL